MKTDVLIIGGGITGLATAYYLHRGGEGMSLSMVLIERAPRLGGLIHTERQDGFLLEAGPDSFLATEAWAPELCRDLGLAAQLTAPLKQASSLHVVWGGRIEPAPENQTFGIPRRYGPFLKSRLFSPLGKIRMAVEPLVPPRADSGDEPVAAFIRRRLGREALERLVGPLFWTVYGTDPELLSLQAVAPRLAQLERDSGSLIRGLRSVRRDGGTDEAMQSARHPFVSLRGGMRELIEALARHLRGIPLLVQTRAEELRPSSDGRWQTALANGSEVESRAVVLALPPMAAARLVSSWNGWLAASLACIPSRSAATVHLGFRRDQVRHRLEGHGLLFPQVDGGWLQAVTWTSSKWPDRAPEDHVLLRCTLSSSRCFNFPAVDDSTLVQRCLGEVRETLDITGEPLLTRVFRSPPLIPQLTVGHLTRMAAVQAEVRRSQGLFVAGNGYRGVGISACVRDAQRTAVAVRGFLSSRAPAPSSS